MIVVVLVVADLEAEDGWGFKVYPRAAVAVCRGFKEERQLPAVTEVGKVADGSTCLLWVVVEDDWEDEEWEETEGCAIMLGIVDERNCWSK